MIALKPDFAALAKFGDQQFIVTAPGTDTDVISRVFVPGGGIDEDSVTGSAHAVLAPYWARRLGRESFSAAQASRGGGLLSCRHRGRSRMARRTVRDRGRGCVLLVTPSLPSLQGGERYPPGNSFRTA